MLHRVYSFGKCGFACHLLVFVRKLMFLKYSCQKPLKKNCGRPVFLEELQAARNFSKVSLHFNKIPNSLRQFLQTYMHFFVCCKQKSSRSSQQRLISKCREILWWNWWPCDEVHIIVNLSQKYEGNLGYEVYHFSCIFFPIFFKCYEFTVLGIYSMTVNKKSVI